jgi:hypothetical protein
MQRNPLQQKKIEDGTMSPSDTVRSADTIVDDEEIVESPSRAELLELVENMQHDWVKLNEYMNRTATYFSWCGDYERRQNSYNDEFKVLRLQPRSDRERERFTGRDDYLLPSLKRLVAQDQRDEVKREQAIAQQDQMVEQLRHQAAELARREERIRERERELMNRPASQPISGTERNFIVRRSRHLGSRGERVEYFIENGEITCRHEDEREARPIRRSAFEPSRFIAHGEDYDDGPPW